MERSCCGRARLLLACTATLSALAPPALAASGDIYNLGLFVPRRVPWAALFPRRFRMDGQPNTPDSHPEVPIRFLSTAQRIFAIPVFGLLMLLLTAAAPARAATIYGNPSSEPATGSTYSA